MCSSLSSLEAMTTPQTERSLGHRTRFALFPSRYNLPCQRLLVPTPNASKALFFERKWVLCLRPGGFCFPPLTTRPKESHHLFINQQSEKGETTLKEERVFAVGLEAGISSMEDPSGEMSSPLYFLCAWAAVLHVKVNTYAPTFTYVL